MDRERDAAYALMQDIDTDEWYIERVHPGGTAGQYWQAAATKRWRGRVLISRHAELIARVQQRPPSGYIVGWPNRVWLLTDAETTMLAQAPGGTRSRANPASSAGSEEPRSNQEGC